MAELAEVRLWDELVGALAYDEGSQFSTFEYAPSWLKNGIEIAPLHMPLAKTKYQFMGLNPDTFRGLPAVFADMLPDDFGNAVINAWLARNGRSAASFTAVERLLYTGTRGMGALTFLPAIKRDDAQSDLAIDSLVSMAQQVLDERVKMRQAIQTELFDNSQQQAAMEAILQVGTSAGGARAKAVVAVNADRTQIRSGQVDVPEGFEHYLLKLDGVVEHKTGHETFGDPLGFGRMEYAYYLMAKDAGIEISPCELLVEGGRAHFMTKRFDRVGNRKRHVVSLCAMDHADYKTPGSYSYEQLLSVARQLKLPRSDAIEIFRRMVFNVIARNHDDHTKNMSFMLDDKTSDWRLSPAFDVAYSYKKDSPWVNTHQMSLNGKRDDFVSDDFGQIASLIGNFGRESKQVVEQVMDVVSMWPSYAAKAGVPDALEQEIQRHLRLSNSLRLR
jgi:serine/threonine-protein kinase HipA